MCTNLHLLSIIVLQTMKINRTLKRVTSLNKYNKSINLINQNSSYSNKCRADKQIILVSHNHSDYMKEIPANFCNSNK
jgi:hypothetical protein